MTIKDLTTTTRPLPLPVIADKDISNGSLADTKKEYIVGPNPSGLWGGQAGKIAYYDQQWRFIEPQNGWQVLVDDEDMVYTYIGNSWVSSSTLMNIKPEIQLVSCRGGVNGEKNTTSAFLNSHSKHRFPYGASKIALVYAGTNQLTSTPSETAVPPGAFVATSVVLGGTMSGYVANEVITFPLNTSSGAANKGVMAVKVRVLTVSGGAPVTYEILNPGAYLAPLAAGIAQASTSGSGTGATATFTWKAFAAAGLVGVEPIFDNQIFTGADCVKAASMGILPDGNRDHALKVPCGDFLISDFLDVDVPIGGYFGIRSLWMGAALPLGRNPMTTDYGVAAHVEEAFSNATFYDESLQNTINAGASSTLFQPVGIIGIPKKVGITIFGWGNSREMFTASGTGALSSNDVMDSEGNVGWLEKACGSIMGNDWPFSNFSRGSQRLALLIPSSNPALTGRAGVLKAISILKPTAVYIGDSVNDFQNGVALATVKSYEEQLIREIRGMGVKHVFTATTDPRTTSSDSWATVANQTVTTATTNSLLRNQALRGGTWASYDSYIDFSPITESSLDSGKWISDGTANKFTGDGVHASPYLINLKAAHAKTVMAANIRL